MSQPNPWGERIYTAVLFVVAVLLFVGIVGVPGSLILDTLVGP